MQSLPLSIHSVAKTNTRPKSQIILSVLAALLTDTLDASEASAAAFPRAERIQTDSATELSWPPLSCTTKPWAYWHWMGSAVDATNLVRELRRYADAGLGGMHIVPIYGAKGWEDRYLPYLSPSWMEALRVALTEARHLGLDIDMTLGTGWNFGGPNITPELSCMRIENRLADLKADSRLTPVANRDMLLALLAESENGQVLDLTEQVGEDGSVAWKRVTSGWRIRTVNYRTGLPAVKRAAPGGEGPMLNPFNRRAVEHYLRRFSDAFASYNGPKPRAVYHDSYEYAGAAWAPDLFEEFAVRRGYRLESRRADLFGSLTNDASRRVRCDFRETLSDLLLEAMTKPWVEWARRHGFLTRNQAHGSPGNLLDLYAAADIPETEMFYKDRDILVSKFASSAAHVIGRPLIAAETGTWVAEHFTETLADLKRNVDDLFLAGVNHIFYHGVCYSPDEAGWPGWLFYAATQFNPRNSIWRDVSALNVYVARCQSILQSCQHDNDLLIYWPTHDLWHDQEPLVEQLSVHRRHWLDDQPMGRLARELWQQGYCFDFVSDRQLASAGSGDGHIDVPGGRYRAVLVPVCRLMPVQTMRQLIELARSGGTVLFDGNIPNDVPGSAGIEERRRELRLLVDGLQFNPIQDGSVREVRLGKGRLLVGSAHAMLGISGVRRELFTDGGALSFVRRRGSDSTDYFIVNRGARAFEGWIPLSSAAKGVGLLDPMSGRVGFGALRQSHSGCAEVFLQLDPHQSMILRAFSRKPAAASRWTYTRPVADAMPLVGTWQVEFIEGGPEIPAPVTTNTLKSWAMLGDEKAQRFAGTARYTLGFDVPTAGRSFQLDLGEVAQSARVRLNGRDLGTLLMVPFRVLADGLKPSGNRLEIEVTSTSANRIRDLDRRGVLWKNFRDINFVGIDYKPFDASNWPLHDAGLLGPVTIRPVELITQP